MPISIFYIYDSFCALGDQKGIWGILLFVGSSYRQRQRQAEGIAIFPACLSLLQELKKTLRSLRLPIKMCTLAFVDYLF